MAQSPYAFKFFFELDNEQKKRFEKLAVTRAVSKGEEVIGHGRTAAHDFSEKNVFFIAEGQFKVLIYSPNGREVPYRVLGPGDHFGELAALDNGPRAATVVSLTPGKLVQLSGAHFEELLKASPNAALWLARGFAGHIRNLTDRIFNLIALNVANRIRSELLRMGYETGGENNQARIRRMPTHQELASLLGTQREAVTRELGALEEQGLISRRARELVILDLDEMRRLVQRASGEDFGVGSEPKPPKRPNGAGRRRRKP